MLDWTRYILFTGADQRGNQPLQNRMTGRQLRQSGSSWMNGPAAAVPAQRIGTQPGTPQPRSPLSNPSPESHPRASQKVDGETLSVGNGYQLCPMQPSHVCRKESLSNRLQGIANDSGRCTFPIVPQKGNDEAFLIFCSKQKTNPANSANAWYP